MIKKVLHIVFLLFLSSNIMAQSSDRDTYLDALNFIVNQKQDSAMIVLKQKPECDRCMFLLADLYYQNGEVLKSVDVYKKLQTNAPQQVFLELARIYAGLGFPEESVFYLTKYFELKNPIYYSEIISYTEFEVIQKSQEWKEFWSERRYSNTELKLEEVAYLIGQNKLNDALSILELLNNSSQKDRIYFYFAEIYFKLNNFDESIRYLNLLLERNAANISALEIKMKIQLENKDFEQAIISSISLMMADSYNPEYIYNHSSLLFKSDRLAEAEKYINTYLDFFPDDEKANYLKTQILTSSQDYRQALINLNVLISKNSSNPQYFIERGDIYFLLESYRFAADDYSMALDIDPKSAHAWTYYGNCQYYLNNSKSACNAWKRAAGMKSGEAVKMLYKHCE